MTRQSDALWSERISSASSEQEIAAIVAEMELVSGGGVVSGDDPDQLMGDCFDDDNERGGMSKLERDREKTEEAQEFGPLRYVADPVRRESCRFDLRLFALTYFSSACWRGFAPYQEEMIDTFQKSGLHGTRAARAVRRGGLKSTLARIAVAWAVLYGHRAFPILTGATDAKSNEHRDNFLKMLKTSEVLRADFPEIEPLLFKADYPKKGVRLDGELLSMTAKDERGVLIFPKISHVQDAAGNMIAVGCSEARVAPYSLMATDVSGLSFYNSAGEVVRPDWLVFDDVQTPQSAMSDALTTKREDAISTTFMGLAGLGETMPAIMVCTVREEDDLTMRFCDRKRHPDWDGKAFPVLMKEPTSKEAKQHWTVYGDKLREGDTPEEGFSLATAYYSEHQAEMDEGGVVSWEQDKEEGYISALQWCMTISILQPDFFRCELQQKGAKPPGAVKQLDAKEIAKRISGIARGIVPAKASYLTAFVDSSDLVLWWMVCAHRPDLSSWIVDWGTWPEQPREYFDKLNPPRSLQSELFGESWEEAFVNAHNKLDEYILGREWPTDDGKKRPIDLLLKDWSDGGQRARIESQVMASKYRTRIRPSKGFAIKPGAKPIHKYGDAQRDRHVSGCWIERRTEQPVHVQVDTNMAKLITARRLQTVVGAPSAMLLPEADEQSITLLCDHFTAEKAKEWIVNGTPGVYFQDMPGRDNDFWDCVVGNVVAASVLGCSLPGETSRAKELRTFKLPGAVHVRA